MKDSTVPFAVQTRGSWGALSGAFAGGKNASSTSEFWKETCWTQIFCTISPRYISLVLSFLLSSVGTYASRDREPLQTLTPLLPAQREITQAFPGLLPSWKHSCNSRAIPLSAVPPPSLRGTDPSWVGAVGEQQPHSGEKPQPALPRPGLPGFPLKHQPSKGGGWKCSLSGRVWQQSESHSAAKSQQHGGARAAQTGGYLTVSRQEKLLSSFSRKAGGVSPTSATRTHTSSAAETRTL